MKKFHVAIGVSNIAASIEDYSRRFGRNPSVVVPNEYALWRTDGVNFSIRSVSEKAGTLRHLGWEDETATQFSHETDVNGIVWELFNEDMQKKEIKDVWPQAKW